MGKEEGRYRIFNISQQVAFLTEAQIQAGLRRKSIKRSAYVLHDQDKYDESNIEYWKRESSKIIAINSKEPDKSKHIKNWAEEKLNDVAEGRIVLGVTCKPAHWHVVLECPKSPVAVSTISKWFGVPGNFIHIPDGHGAFLDCVEYLTHEKQPEKFRYPDGAIMANFKWRDELNKRNQSIEKYGQELSLRDWLRNEVTHSGMSLRFIRENYPVEYTADMEKLKKCHQDYIEKYAPLPKARVNYYVCGDSGDGKGFISKALARSIIDPKGTLPDEEIFFEVGAKGVNFDGYDCQPVIIWNDFRAIDILSALSGRTNAFNVFDPYPTGQCQNVKFGKARLVNKVNIVNSVQPWDEFLDGLAGQYKDKDGNEHKAEDKKQSYRRFPFFIVVHQDDFDIGFNKGIFDGNRNFEEYYQLQNVRGSMKCLADVCGYNQVLRDRKSRETLDLIVKGYNVVEDIFVHPQKGTDEEIDEMFKDYGKPSTLPDFARSNSRISEIFASSTSSTLVPCEVIEPDKPKVTCEVIEPHNDDRPTDELWDDFVRVTRDNFVKNDRVNAVNLFCANSLSFVQVMKDFADFVKTGSTKAAYPFSAEVGKAMVGINNKIFNLNEVGSGIDWETRHLDYIDRISL